jgi:DNA-binding winged helix-turn-helix (wHTH) protein
VKVLHSGFVGTSYGSNGEGTRRFGVFELDLRAGELRRQGLKIKLQEQPFQVLAQLLERPGHVVSREELRNRLWPADTFVDFDHSLNAAIRRLRDAVGDSAENPRFVETVARRGYRFLAPVSFGNGNGTAVTQPATVEPVSRPNPFSRPVDFHRRGLHLPRSARHKVRLVPGSAARDSSPPHFAVDGQSRR